MNFFKPEDFRYLNITNATQRLESLQELASNIANTIIQREGKIVYFLEDDHWENGSWTVDTTYPPAKTKALLINIEPNEKCQHPKEKITITSVSREMYNKDWDKSYECECGAKVKPTVFEEV